VRRGERQHEPRIRAQAAASYLLGFSESHRRRRRAGATDAPAESLHEIIVTAEKRTSTVQDTPISVTAVTGAQIEQRGFTDFTSLSQTVPGISMKSSGPGQTEFEMRGMTSSGGNSATVGFYLDDTPLSAPAAAQNGKVVIDPNLYDLNRIEVLRGPQGTLYGSGSMGGTIKVITNQPDPSAFDVSGKVILSNTDGGGFNNGESAMINLPLINGAAALRIVGSYEHDSGWIDRVVIADGQFPLETDNNTVRGDVLAAPVAQNFKQVNDETLYGARATLLIKPTDNFSITPSFFYQQISQGGLNDIDTNPGTNANYQPFNSPEPFMDSFYMGTLNLQAHWDPVDLTSVTSYWNRNQQIRQDGSEELQQVLSGPFSGLGCPVPLPFYTNQTCGLGQTTPTPLENDKSWQWTEELRLASAGDTRFTWLIGYFYQDFQSDWNLTVPQPGAATMVSPATAPDCTLCTGNGFLQFQPTKIVQNSFFGEISFKFTPELTGTVGLRRYYYTNEVTTDVSGYLSSTGSDAVAHSTNSEKDEGVNPKVGLSLQPNKDLLLYATASKGFRPGGANQPVPTSGSSLGRECEQDLMQIYGTTSTVPAPNTFKSDSVWTYELGEKWRTNDSKLTLNGAVYYSQWKEAQQFVGLSCGFNFSTNTGNADIYGGELELDAILAPGLELSANGDYTHAEFIESTVLPGVIALNGLQVQDVPKYSGALQLSYNHPITPELSFTGLLQSTYTASRTQVTNALQTLPSYALTNIRAGVQGEKWSAVLFANNLFNKVAWYSYAYQINVGIPTFQRANVSQPLTIGIDVTYHLGK
jgi:outer membrane receptor protein involved in Fe transport